jgi:hypothetical protein
MMKAGGVPLEDEYSNYLGQDGYCHAHSASLVAPITGYVNVTYNDPAAFKVAQFKNGPLSISIDAAHKTFYFYSHGVYYEPKRGNLLKDIEFRPFSARRRLWNYEG